MTLKRASKLFLIVALAGTAAAFAAVEAAKVHLGPPPLANAEGLSTTVIDRNGRMVEKKLGAMTKAEMEAAIKRVL